MSASVGRRYAKAIFALAKEAGSLEESAEQLRRLGALVHDPALGPVLRSPLLSAERRRQLAQTLARDLSLSDLMTRFAGVLADHHRLDELPAIAEHFDQLLDHELGRVRIRVRSARQLEAPEAQQIVNAFARLTNKQVLSAVSVDPNLLGGVLVELGTKIYDGTVRTQLERLAKELGGSTTR